MSRDYVPWHFSPKNSGAQEAIMAAWASQSARSSCHITAYQPVPSARQPSLTSASFSTLLVV